MPMASSDVRMVEGDLVGRALSGGSGRMSDPLFQLNSDRQGQSFQVDRDWMLGNPGQPDLFVNNRRSGIRRVPLRRDDAIGPVGAVATDALNFVAPYVGEVIAATAGFVKPVIPESLYKYERATPVVNGATQQVVAKNPGPSASKPIKKLKQKLAALAGRAETNPPGGPMVAAPNGAQRRRAAKRLANEQSFAMGRQVMAREMQLSRKENGSVQGRGIAPSAVPNISARREFIDQKTGDAVISGCDFLGAVSITSLNNVIGGVLFEYALNPQQVSTPSLNQFSQLYQKFEFLEAALVYTSSEAFTYGGSINALWDSDVADNDGIGLQLVQQAATTRESHENPILRSTRWDYNAKIQAKGEYYCAADTSTAAGLRQTEQGHVKLFVVNKISQPTSTPVDPLVIGSLYLVYRVRFWHRQLNITLSSSINAVLGTALYPQSNSLFFGSTVSGRRNTAWLALFTDGGFSNNMTPLVPGVPANYGLSFKRLGSFIFDAKIHFGSAAQTSGQYNFYITVTNGAAFQVDSDGNSMTSFTQGQTTTFLGEVIASAGCVVNVTSLPATINFNLSVTGSNLVLTTGNEPQFNAWFAPCVITDVTLPSKCSSKQVSECTKVSDARVLAKTEIVDSSLDTSDFGPCSKTIDGNRLPPGYKLVRDEPQTIVATAASAGPPLTTQPSLISRLTGRS